MPGRSSRNGRAEEGRGRRRREEAGGGGGGGGGGFPHLLVELLLEVDHVEARGRRGRDVLHPELAVLGPLPRRQDGVQDVLGLGHPALLLDWGQVLLFSAALVLALVLGRTDQHRGVILDQRYQWRYHGLGHKSSLKLGFLLAKPSILARGWAPRSSLSRSLSKLAFFKPGWRDPGPGLNENSRNSTAFERWWVDVINRTRSRVWGLVYKGFSN